MVGKITASGCNEESLSARRMDASGRGGTCATSIRLGSTGNSAAGLAALSCPGLLAYCMSSGPASARPLKLTQNPTPTRAAITVATSNWNKDPLLLCMMNTILNFAGIKSYSAKHPSAGRICYAWSQQVTTTLAAHSWRCLKGIAQGPRLRFRSPIPAFATTGHGLLAPIQRVQCLVASANARLRWSPTPGPSQG